MNMGNKNITRNYNQGVTDIVKCGRCATCFDIRVGVVLTECNHLFCIKCIKRLFDHNLGFFKCLNPETGKTRCQKLVMRTAIREIYNFDDYLSCITGSVPYEEKLSEFIPSFQNEQSTNDRHDSTCGNLQASTSNKYYFSTGRDEQLTNVIQESTRENEESTSNKYISTGLNQQSTSDVCKPTRGNEESAINKYCFSTGLYKQLTIDMGNKNITGNYNQGVTDIVKCGRCATCFDIRVGVVLTECDHLFCTKCIKRLFEHNLGFFKCPNPETGKTSRCQKLVTMTAIREIYNIDDYLSCITGSVPDEEKLSEFIPYFQNEQSTNNQHDSIQNEQSTNDRHDSTCGNLQACTSNKHYFSTGRDEQLTNDVRESTYGNEESTNNKYVSTGLNEQLTSNVRESTLGNEESARNKYSFSTGLNEQLTSNVRESTLVNEEYTRNKYVSTGLNEQLTSNVRESTLGNEEYTRNKYVSTGQNEQPTNTEHDSTLGKEESTSNKYCISTSQNENTKNKEPSFDSENQEPETSKANDEVLKFKEHKEPMSHEPKNYQDATQCRNPECKVWLFYGEEQYSKKFFTCPDCKQRNCFLCKLTETHGPPMGWELIGSIIDQQKGLHNPAAINCAEYKKTLKNTSEHSEDLLKKMLENNEAMLCPQCKETLLKDNGCDFITCFWCKVELCWVTRGYRWGACGPGDTSGGCRCGVNGIKCHPNCRGCH